MLKALGAPLPKTLLVHGWWQKDGAKLSKSTGNVVDPVAVIAEWGLDAFRYYVVRELGIGPDGNWTDAGFKALVRLMKDGAAWAKMTGPYRLTGTEMPYPDTDDFAFALVDAAPQRLVWGTDWPHVIVKTRMPNDGDIADLLGHWVPDVKVRDRILVDNPAELYGF
jgi:hypothetical protein